MILEKYIPNFDSLSTDQAFYLAEKMQLPETDLSGHDIYVVAESAGMDQADVVMTLATDPSLTGIQVVEALIGKPIERRRKPSPTARTPGAPRKSVSVVRNDPRKIVHVSPTNPKKEGSASHARFALYREGMTVTEFVAAGGTLGDIKWDAERGFIKLEGAE